MPLKNYPEESVQKKVSDEKFEGNVLFESPGNRINVRETLSENNLRNIDRVIATNLPDGYFPDPNIRIYPRKSESYSFMSTLKDFLMLMKEVDWKRVREELGGSLKSLGIAIAAFGDKELVNIELPNIERLFKGLENLISKLPPIDQQKIRSQIEKIQEELKKRLKKEGGQQQISPEKDWIARERAKNDAYQKAIENPTRGFTAPRGEALKRDSLEQAISDLTEMLDKTVDPETRKKIRSILTTLSLLLATLPFLSASSQISNKAEAQNIYGDIYGNTPTEEERAERRVVRQIPDEGVSEKIDILKGIKISNAEDSLELFGARLGSKMGIAGENIITIENKSDDRGSSTVMRNKDRMGDFIIVTKDAEGKKVYIDLKNYTTEINGDIALDLNGLPEEIIYSIINGHLIWGDFEYKNGVATSSFVQRGEITGVKDEAQGLLNNIIMSRILGERNRNIQ